MRVQPEAMRWIGEFAGLTDVSVDVDDDVSRTVCEQADLAS
jgi:hypothetical protein